MLPVAGQRTAFRTVAAGDHTGLQQIVLAVSEAGGGQGTSGARQEIVAIPATLAPQVSFFFTYFYFDDELWVFLGICRDV